MRNLKLEQLRAPTEVAALGSFPPRRGDST